LNNERLLKRLYKAAQADIDANNNGEDGQHQVHFRDEDGTANESKMGQVDKSVLEMHR